MIVISLSLRVPDRLRGDFLSGLTQLVDASRAEPGVISYSFAEDVHIPNLFRVFELYRDHRALDAHLQSDHFQKWRANSGEFVREDKWLLEAVVPVT